MLRVSSAGQLVAHGQNKWSGNRKIANNFPSVFTRRLAWQRLSGAKSPAKDCKLEFVSHVAAVAVAVAVGSGGAGAVTAMLFFHGAHTVLLKGPPA